MSAAPSPRPLESPHPSAPSVLSVEVDGVIRPSTNSSGAPIHATEEGVRNFWRWFGTSKTVDADGRPLVLYHGTGKRFAKVNLRKGAQGLLWLTSTRAAIEAGEAGAQGSGVIMELYARLESPADWRQYENLTLGEFKGRGLDGAILSNDDIAATFDAFIMSPLQVKSAVGNSGAFDPSNPSLSDKPPRMPPVPTRGRRP